MRRRTAGPAAAATAIVLAGFLGVARAQPPEDQDDHAGHDHAGHDDAGHDDHPEAAPEAVVSLDAAERTEFGIEIGVAGPDTVEILVTVPGEVRPNADRLAHIVPRFSGIVTDVPVHLGDRVQKGQVLATVESDESLAPFQVRTLIGGTVIEKHIALGEAVSRERDTFVIADLSTVWVDLTVYQRDLARIRTGQLVQVFIGHDGSPEEGTISYITPIVDEVTRTATARVELPNTDGRWRPGMFVRGRIRVEHAAVPVAVPATALYALDGETVVFVEDGNGFAPRVVTTGRSNERVVEIRDGLAAGERFIRSGGLTVKAELQRESLGHAGHAH